MSFEALAKNSAMEAVDAGADALTAVRRPVSEQPVQGGQSVGVEADDVLDPSVETPGVVVEQGTLLKKDSQLQREIPASLSTGGC